MDFSREKLQGAFIILAAISGFALTTFSDPDSEPEPNVSCTFNANPDQAPIKLGSLTAPINSFTLSGYLDDPFEDRLYDLRGKAALKIDGVDSNPNVRGSMFLNDQKEVIGLLVYVEDAGFGRDGLKVFTLDESGVLDYNSTEALAFVSKEFKFAHPLGYSCTVDREELPTAQ